MVSKPSSTMSQYNSTRFPSGSRKYTLRVTLCSIVASTDTPIAFSSRYAACSLLPARGFADRPALRRGLLHLTGETLHRMHHRRDAGPRQVERHPLGAEGPHPADV